MTKPALFPVLMGIFYSPSGAFLGSLWAMLSGSYQFILFFGSIYRMLCSLQGLQIISGELNTPNWPLGPQKQRGRAWTRLLGSTILPYFLMYSLKQFPSSREHWPMVCYTVHGALNTRLYERREWKVTTTFSHRVSCGRSMDVKHQRSVCLYSPDFEALKSLRKDKMKVPPWRKLQGIWKATEHQVVRIQLSSCLDRKAELVQ